MKIYLIIALSLISLAVNANPRPLDLSLDQKEVKALQLINMVGRYNNDRFSNDLEKGESEDAYYSFLARFQNLKEDKTAMSSETDLKNCSDRYDLLIKDLQKFLK